MGILRRQLGALAFGFVACVVLPFSSAQAGFKPFNAATYQAAKQSGEPFVLDFFADWCTTCQAQHRAIKKLQDEDAGYKNLDILVVDWDARFDKSSAEAKVINELNIPRRSTLVMFTNGSEVDRVVAQTRMKVIKALFDQGL